MVRKQSDSSASRRRFIKVAGATGIAGLAGCLGGGGGGGGTAGSSGSGTTTLQFWTLFAGGDGEAMKSMVDQFNEEHDSIQVERQRQPFAEYYDKLFTAMTGGNAPDLAVFHTTELQRFVQAMQPLGDLLSSGASDAYVSSIWDQTQFDGSRVALPLDTHPNGLYYNKDIFEEAGLDPESPPTSFSELTEAANTIESETDKLAFSPDPYNLYQVRQYIAWLRGRGGTFLNEDKTSAEFGDAEGTALGEFYGNITNEWGWDRPDATENRGTKAFRSGDMAMTINGTWYYGVLQSQDFEWGMTQPFVGPEQSTDLTWANSHTLGVPAGTDKAQAATEVAEWLTQNSLTWGTDAGHLPAASGVLESDDLRSATVWEKTLSTYNEMAQNGALAYMPSTENNQDYQRPVNKAIQQIYSGQAEAADVIPSAAEQVTSNLQG
ncbi:ABC transporter substrate-binding protein [Salinirubrum litoreum]|uniref:ABC transporter substrate-binding protein n=1 Tax=Salinirubrum litoreum TaxID=1126234 RepID=A0ABD5RBA5_9EURY|nr:ABC transporter substrate-binding protein [Salinirubrum litoreum]